MKSRKYQFIARFCDSIKLWMFFVIQNNYMIMFEQFVILLISGIFKSRIKNDICMYECRYNKIKKNLQCINQKK